MTAQATRARRQPVPVAPEPVRPAGPPLWLQIVSLVLALCGLGISIYETWAHYNGSRLFACSGTGTFNCSAVITSPQSMVFGVIPVAILGLVFYVFVVAIMTPWAWRIQRREVGLLRLGSMIAGMGFVMYLIYAELYQIGDVCEYCSGVHIITFLLFCITVVSAAIWGLGAPKNAS
ncbi:MAG TPA: vitamin K epoxide reductase family protein [Trebonia sp.]|nr:vitamin K epoxide reductase family protein [Trebonia sp.]